MKIFKSKLGKVLIISKALKWLTIVLLNNVVFLLRNIKIKLLIIRENNNKKVCDVFNPTNFEEFIINKGLKNEVERRIFVSWTEILLLLYLFNVMSVFVGFPTNILASKIEEELTESNRLKGFRILLDNLIKNRLFVIIDEIIYMGTIEGIITSIKILQTSNVEFLKFIG